MTFLPAICLGQVLVIEERIVITLISAKDDEIIHLVCLVHKFYKPATTPSLTNYEAIQPKNNLMMRKASRKKVLG